MTTKFKSPAYKKQTAPKLTSKSIQEQTKAFLKSGGKIQYIKAGTSGQKNIPGPKHIVLDSKPKNN